MTNYRYIDPQITLKSDNQNVEINRRGRLP